MIKEINSLKLKEEVRERKEDKVNVGERQNARKKS